MTRDELRKLAAAAIYGIDHGFGDPPFYLLDPSIQEAYGRAWDSALSAAEAHGWVLAPKVPTIEMIDAGVRADYGKTLGSRVENAWQAMLEAATRPQEGTDGR